MQSDRDEIVNPVPEEAQPHPSQDRPVAVRARFRVQQITEFDAYGNPGDVEVKLRAVTHDTLDNVSWSKFTPDGTLTMRITNLGAQGHFKPGREFYLDFTEAD